MLENDSFRPLNGVIILNQVLSISEMENMKKVSVPLTGLSFLIWVAKIHPYLQFGFRPLNGVIILNRIRIF